MNSAGRIIVVAIVGLGTFYLAYWLPLALIPFEAYSWAAPIIALLCAVGAGRYVWVSQASSAASNIIPTMLLWATIAGGIGFVAGFVGPIIFAPGANQGPLLGIFITGPLGFVLGGIAGLVYAVRKKRKNGSLERIADDA